MRERRTSAARLALLHGACMAAAPLIERATGRTMGRWPLAGVAVGGALFAAGARGKVALELRLLGAALGVVFAAMALRRRRTPIEIVSGAAELGFAALWGAAGLEEILARRRPPEPAFA